MREIPAVKDNSHPHVKPEDHPTPALPTYHLVNLTGISPVSPVLVFIYFFYKALYLGINIVAYYREHMKIPEKL